MHLLFMDESGTPPKPGQNHPRYFVVGGLIVPETIWSRMRDGLYGLKIRHRVRGELKWRYFAPSNDDRANPMRAMDTDQRNAIRDDLFRLLAGQRGLVAIACIVSGASAYKMPSVNEQDDVYHLAYKGVTERFQYHLQDLSRGGLPKQLGLVVSDHRGTADDRTLRQVHQKLLHSKGEFITQYDNLVEGLFLTPSHMSVGVQLADLVAGAVWRAFERGDPRWLEQLMPIMRKGPAGQVDGFGLIKSPKRGWE